MRRIQQLIMISLLACLPAVCMATSYIDDPDDSDTVDLDSYVGVGVRQNWFQAVDHWSPVIRDNALGFDVFVGGYINDCWSVDVGYDWTTDNPKSTYIQPGGGMLGVVNTTATPFHVVGKFRIKAAHFDLNYFFPPKRMPISGIVSVGIAIVKSAVELAWTHGVLQSAEVLFPVQGKTKAYPRVGVGVQGMFSEDYGFRAMLRWENTAKIRAHFGAANIPDFKKITHNGASLEIALLFKV